MAERAPDERAASHAEAEALIAELERKRQPYAAADRRARTYLVRHGVVDQTLRDVSFLLRETRGLPE